MAEILMILGVSILGILGSVHLIFTFFSRNFEARDPALTEAMKQGAPVISDETTVWKAWIGFNASHSLGGIFLAALYIPLILFHFEIIENSLWFSSVPLAASLVYVFLAKKYWFNVPFYGISLASLCFAAALFLNIFIF